MYIIVFQRACDPSDYKVSDKEFDTEDLAYDWARTEWKKPFMLKSYWVEKK